jgi:radical SAM superfamily enzyme YgiQ (UPF0313 family)
MDELNVYFYDYFDEQNGFLPSVGLYSVLSYASEYSQKKIKLISIINYKDFEKIENNSNSFVAISLTSSLHFSEVEKVLFSLKKIKDKKFTIVVGGYGIYKLDENDLKKKWPEINFIIIGKGEELFNKILNREIKEGIYYNKTEISKFSVIQEDLLNRIEKKRSIPISISGTTCKWGKCSFCSHNYSYGKAEHGPYAFYKMIEYYYKKGYSNFYITDNWLDFDRFYETLDFLYSNGITNISFKIVGCNLNSNWKKLENYINKFDKNTFTGLMWGIEWLDDIVLKRINKGITVKRIFEHASFMNNLGIELIPCLMFGLPLITDDEINVMYNNLLEYDKYVSTYCPSFYRLLPNSFIYKNLDKWNIKITDQHKTNTEIQILEKTYDFNILNPSTGEWLTKEENMLRYKDIAEISFMKSDIEAAPVLQKAFSCNNRGSC